MFQRLRKKFVNIIFFRENVQNWFIGSFLLYSKIPLQKGIIKTGIKDKDFFLTLKMSRKISTEIWFDINLELIEIIKESSSHFLNDLK